MRDPNAVRAFKVHRNADNVVELLWKKNPEEKDWCGEKHDVVNTGGFNILKHATTGQPSTVEPKDIAGRDDITKELSAPSVRRAAIAEKVEASLENILKCVSKNEIVHTIEEDESPDSDFEWGRRCTVGAKEGQQGALRLIILRYLFTFDTILTDN